MTQGYATLIDQLLSDGPPPLGSPRPRVEVVRQDADLLTVSGQVATGADGVLVATGTVGAQVDIETARRCAWQCAANVVSRALAVAGGVERIERVVKVTVYVASTPDFVQQHLVADAATEFMVRVFGEAGRHARAAIGVAALPTGSPVEVEATLRLRTG